MELAKWRQKHILLFFKCSLNFRAIALQSELNKVSTSNFVKFQLQSMSSKIERAFKKTTKFFNKIRLKRTSIRQLKRTINQCKISYMRKKTFFCKNVLLYNINNKYMVLEIIISKFPWILKIMSRNTFPELQPDSASYVY